MYSPLRSNVPKEEQRQHIKEQKKQQLTILLVNKFRNKYMVNGAKEFLVDKIIKEEIKSMFDQGTPSEAALNKLDKRLEVLIKKARENPELVAANNNEDAKSTGARSNGSRGAIMR